MTRLFCFLFLISAALAWPTSASAQILGGSCQFDSYIEYRQVPRDAPAPPGSVTNEIRGRAGVPIEARCGDVVLIADEIDYLQPEERLVARGAVVFQQTDTRIVAARGEFEVNTRTGFFEDASGTLQLTDREIDRSLFGAQEPEAVFSADRIEKIGPKKYRLTHAVFSACVQPNRRWEVTAGRLTFTLDKYAVMRNAVLKVKDVPIAYLPIFYYPIQGDGRATGFLMPTYGSSTLHGFTLSNAFFWALGRSHDATLYYDWFASSGQGYGGDYRYVGGPSSRGDARVYVVREKAQIDSGGTVIRPARQSFDVRGNLSQSLPGRIRFQARADYFSDAESEQLYQVDLSSLSRRRRYFGVSAAGNWGRLRASAQGERNDVFYGTDVAASYRFQPRVNVSVSEAPLWGTPFYVGSSLEYVHVVRYNDVFKPETRTDIVRTDGSATVRLPLSLGSALTMNSSVSFRRTDWDLSRDPESGALVKSPLTRNLVEMRGRLVGPVFTRVFNTPGNGFAERFKHVIEPAVTIQKLTKFDRFDEVAQFDSVDTVLGGVTTVTYGLTNTLLARVRKDDGQAEVRPVMSVEVSQTYYTNALAARYDRQYQSSFNGLYSYLPPPSNFSPIRGTVNLTPSPALGGQFVLEYDTQFHAVRSYRASLNTSHRLLDLNGTWSKRQVIKGLQGFDNPLRADHFLTVAARAKKPGEGASLGYSMTYDVLRDRMLQQRLNGYYNAQCCGVAVDYAVTNLSHFGLRDDKRLTLSFTLAGLGSFSNMMGAGPQR